MSTNYTEHLGLTLWEADDPVLRTEFNANHRKLDDCIRALPRIAVGSYVGTGDSGSAAPNTLTFDFNPQLIIIAKDIDASLDLGTIMIRGQSHNPGFGYVGSSSNCLALTLSWTDNSVSWYTGNAGDQLNNKGVTYCYFAVGI